MARALSSILFITSVSFGLACFYFVFTLFLAETLSVILPPLSGKGLFASFLAKNWWLIAGLNL